VLRATHLTVYELRGARPLASGGARVRRLEPTGLLLQVPRRGWYRVAIRFSPYWETLQGCVAPTADGMTGLYAFRRGRVDLDFKLNVGRGLEALTGREPSRFCSG